MMSLHLVLARWLLAAGLLCTAHDALAASGVPPDSVYQLQVGLTDQDGHAFALADRQGKPQLVTMFYTSCQFVCPRIVDTLRDIQRALPASAQGRYGILMVTLDPARDDAAALRRLMDERRLDARQWTLARTAPADTRRLAAVLGVQYRALPNGDFNHSTTVLLLDRDGRVIARSSRLGQADPALLAQLNAALAP